MQNKKLQALDAILSLVVTAIKWINMEFPNSALIIEIQTIREILNDLEKANTALQNLILYEKGMFEEHPLKTLPPLKYVGKVNDDIKVTWPEG